MSAAYTPPQSTTPAPTFSDVWQALMQTQKTLEGFAIEAEKSRIEAE